MSMIGKSLLHYEISDEIGKGGMGEVYQAKDTKLGRDVAIKVLPEEFALDTDRVARFQREAKLLASLNHPNIAAIHGLEESEGTHFLVMELIEGDTLRDRIKSGPIPVEESLKLALQMAEALEAAHEKGVIHRDLKPANIKVTPDGKVKILDFGLAKAYVGDQENMSPMDSPTISAAATQQGVILGTAAYMSPEQARGKPVDKRADIWAFGVVLYEILTGKTAFQGEDVTDTLASVVKLNANMEMLPADLHYRVRELLSRCLQKDTRKRYSGIGDARYEIEQVLSDPSGVFVQSVTTAKPRTKLRLGIPWVAVITILSIIIAGLTVWYLKPHEPHRLVRFDYHLPVSQELSGATHNSLVVSADGTKIVYVANDQLYLKNLNEFIAKPIHGTDENPMLPFFSPDGQWVGYRSLDDGHLKKISILGGVSVTLCEDLNAIGATWGTDDMIVFGTLGGIMRVSANGGIPEQIIEGEENEWLVFPQILPDGKSVLFTVFSMEEREYQVAVQSLEAGERKELFPGGAPARFLPTGHLVYGLENNLTTIRFDPESLETIGGPVPLVDEVFRWRPDRSMHWAISDSGTLVYIPGGMGTSAFVTGNLVWVDREGREEPLKEGAKAYYDPKISPDGKRVALRINEDGNNDIYIYDLVRGTTMRLTFYEGDDFNPIWTPDSQRIIFASWREEAGSSIFWKSADGTGKVEQIASMEGISIWPRSISNDGNTLFFVQREGGIDRNIGVVSMEDERTPKLLLQENYNEIDPQISPDGRWLAYQSNESGQYEVFVRPFPDVDSGGKWQVSTDGGRNPLWSPDGSELFYVDLNEVPELMVVSVETDPIFSLGTPQSLITGPYIDGDIDPDGKRFLAIKEVDTRGEDSIDTRSSRINIVLNWFEELKERVPVD